METKPQKHKGQQEHETAFSHANNQVTDEIDIDPKLLALLDQVCAFGEDALPQLKAYIDDTKTENVGSTHPDAESALKAFKEQHAAAFETHKHTRVRRWGYRLCVIAAAIIVLNTFCIFAFGRSIYDYAAMWGAETFGYIMQTANPEKYDPDTYYNPREQYIGELPEYDPNAPLGSEENPIPLDSLEPLPEYANIPDTDVSALGLEKSKSEWDHSHMIETFRILNSDTIEVATALGINIPAFPTWIPDGFVLDEILVTKDHESSSMDLDISYEKRGEKYLFGVSIISSVLAIDNALECTIIEKDDRPVITYTAGNVDWYIMHNLDTINATTIVDDYLILISGPVTVDEMKKVIDSVYEGE
ncbi:hypothetical protein [Agathobaculum sp. Marseille-P7918]|uniref:hypothetical protein n=1 Tax=Agathobaculum sp. Marseille-P7918 TaxID=2479843 RepID=UPI000F635113|nr:hypothetical protein [Agathobaculum sp. Marseille-P7918]